MDLVAYFSNALLFDFAMIYICPSHHFYSFSQELLQASTYLCITVTSTSFDTFTPVLPFVSASAHITKLLRLLQYGISVTASFCSFCRPEKLHKKMSDCTPSQLVQIFAKIVFGLCLENRIATIFVWWVGLCNLLQKCAF